MIYEYMKNLINKKFYATAEDAQGKLDVFFAANRLTEAQYLELTALVNEKYATI